MKLSEFLLLRLRATFRNCLYFICERKFYARTHVKITVKINPKTQRFRVRVRVNYPYRWIASYPGDTGRLPGRTVNKKSWLPFL